MYALMKGCAELSGRRCFDSVSICRRSVPKRIWISSKENDRAQKAQPSRKEKNMQINKCIKEAFTVIGKEGSTRDGEGFIQKLWEDANSHFQEVEQLAKRDEKGGIKSEAKRS